jgi:hypothetical protein
MDYLGLAALVFVHIASAHFPRCKFVSCNDAPRRDALTVFLIVVALFHHVIGVIFPIAVTAILLNMNRSALRLPRPSAGGVPNEQLSILNFVDRLHLLVSFVIVPSAIRNVVSRVG